MLASTKHPSGIPAAVRRDRPLVLLVSVRRNLLESYAELSKRINPYDKKRSEKEKRRTKQRKEIADQLRSVERDIMRWLGEHAKHPDVWTPKTVERGKDPLDPSTFSRYDQLKRRWRDARQQPGSSINPIYRRQMVQTKTKTRHSMAAQIQALEWRWMSALHERIFPNTPLPPRRVIHPTRYTP